LGFGLLSTGSAFAADAAANEVASISLAQAAGTPTVGSAVPLITATVNFAAAKAEDDDVVNLVALLVDQPAGSNLSLDATVSTNAAGATLLVDGAAVVDGVVATATAAVNNAAGLDNTTAAQKFATLTFTPTAAGTHTLRVFHDANADGLYTVGEVSATIAVPVSSVATAATEASIKGTATSVNVSAVSLTTVEPSNRVGVAVIATPAASFLNTSANDTTTDSHKASLVYVLTKPAGSAATLNATSATILSGAAIDGTDAGGDGTTVGETVSRSGSNLTFTPDVAGTYTITAWHESVVDGALSTSEATASRSFVVGANELKMTISTFGSLVKGADDAGSLLVKIALTGADGKAASLNTNESIVVTRTAGTAAIDFVTNDGTFAAGFGNGSAADTAASTYTFNAAQFSSAGVAAFLVNDDTAEGLSTWTINGAGGAAAALSYSMTTTASKATTAAATNGSGTISNTTGVAGDLVGDAGTTNSSTIAYAKATTVGFTYTKSAATDIARYDVVDTSGNITGITGAKFAKTAGSSSSTVTTGTFSESLTLSLNSSLALANATVTIGTTVYSITAAYPVVTSVTNPDLQIRSVIADTNTIRVLVKDQFGIAFPLASVTPVVTGRNATLPAQPTLWTNANGYAYYTVKDVSTSTTSLTDTVNFTSAAVQGASGTTAVTSTAATVITYVSTLNVGTVTLTTPNSAEVTAGTALTPIDINAGSTGAEAGAVTVSAKVVDANSSILTGVKVTWSIVGTSGGAAVTSTTVSGYTDATGVATAKVYGWVAGAATVTATVGGVAKGGALLFAQNTPTEVRTATTTVDGRVVTVVAKDRFGNVVKDAPFTATAVGNGFFGTGTNIVANALTDATGTVKFLLLEAKSDVTVKVEFGATAGLLTPYGQSGYAAGAVDNIATAATAPTTGTIETDETGVGNVAAYLPKGTGAMSGAVIADTTDVDTAQAAADAAAEATDAANAATDAANAAAEAADAATAAAQDAADAVAALSTQVSEMVNALKKQITALTNLVIKIQKKVRA
jgi:hypothetical protein